MISTANVQTAGLIGVGVIGGAYLVQMVPGDFSPMVKLAALAAVGIVAASMVDGPMKMVALGVAGGAVAKAIGSTMVLAI